MFYRFDYLDSLTKLFMKLISITIRLSEVIIYGFPDDIKLRQNFGTKIKGYIGARFSPNEPMDMIPY